MDSEEIKAHCFFFGIDWDQVLAKKLKIPKYHRKIKICTKYDNTIFSQTSFVENEREKLPDWSFINPET